MLFRPSPSPSDPPRRALCALLAAAACALGPVLAAGLPVAGPAPGGPGEPAPAAASGGFFHEVFTVRDGLPVGGIIRILQGRDGYLWLATFDGLARFDGTRFEVFESERTPELGSDRIYDLVVAADGALWIRTEQGHLSRYAGGGFAGCARPVDGRARCAPGAPPAAYYTLLAQDRAGDLWTGGPAGAFRISGEEIEAVPGLVTDAPVESLLRARDGGLWLGTVGAVWVGRHGGSERLVPPADPAWQGVPSLAEDAEGRVWVGTPAAVGRFEAGAFVRELEGRGSVAGDAGGTVWISRGDRLVRYRDRRLEAVAAGAGGGLVGLHADRHLAAPAGGDPWVAWFRTLLRDGEPVVTLSDPAVTFESVAVDREGTVWAGTSRSGELHAFHPVRLDAFGSAEGLPSINVYPLYEDADGAIWAGGPGLLARLFPGRDAFSAVPSPLAPHEWVTAFLRDRAGTFWLGATSGVYTGGPEGFAPAGPETGHLGPVVALFEDSRGVLWAGTERGLFQRPPGREGRRWERAGAEGGLDRAWVRAIRESPAGTLWFGTNGAGVIRLAGGRATAITRAHGLSSDLVRALYPAPDGRLWIGSENAGLDRLDPATVDRPGAPAIATVGKDHGLPTSGIHQIVPDGRGNLWISGNDGIFRVVAADLDAVADGHRARLYPVVYDERDGMPDRECNGGVQDAGLRDRRGRLWFPTQRGVVRLDPSALLGGNPPPPVIVERLVAGEESIPLSGGEIDLAPHQRSFSVVFAAPSFRAPERLRFRYRLRPYDPDWVEVAGRREAGYTKVPPGRYRFEVLARSADGTWNARPAVAAIHVEPRPFETRWFLAACAIAALLAAAGLLRLRGVRYRARQHRLERQIAERTATIAEQAEKLRELDRLKSQLFANVSHELRTPLTLILGPLGDALDGHFGPLGAELAPQLEVTRDNARRLLGLVDQLLDVARLDAGRLEVRLRPGNVAAHVQQRVEGFAPLAERRGIELALEVPAGPVEVWFDPEQLRKVFDNLLGNALKFTPPGGRVRVAIAAPASGEVAVAVEDDGPGIPADQLDSVFDRFYRVEGPSRPPVEGTGIGLALARQLVELHRGTIEVESALGRGTRFTVRLRRGRSHLPPELVAEEPAVAAPPQTAVAAPAGAGTGEPASQVPGDGEDRTTVLVVDDNADLRAYVRRHLEPDYRVVEAADGTAGLELARRLTPDLVVSDLMMPGLDGGALFRALRADPELDLVPVVLLTARAGDEDRLDCLEQGVDDYLVKPFEPRELRARIENLLARRRRLLERFSVPPRALRARPVEAAPADEAFLARVQATVEEFLADPDLTVEGLARTLRCDRSYLLRKLRALTGESPSEVIRSLRLQRAEQLLAAGAGPVGEIALSVGFKSAAHFSNAFHARYGERPSAYAARHREGRAGAAPAGAITDAREVEVAS